MPISLTPFDYPDICTGCYWTVNDEDALAEHIARIALGQARYVERIIIAAGGPLIPAIFQHRIANVLAQDLILITHVFQKNGELACSR